MTIVEDVTAVVAAVCSILWTSKALPGCISSHLTDCSVRSGRRWAAVPFVEHGRRTATLLSASLFLFVVLPYLKSYQNQ